MKPTTASLVSRLQQDKPQIMGILNITPDSFSDGGRYVSVEAAVKRGQAMLAAGATIIDVGGESTRPGAERIAAEEQQRRVLPVIQALAGQMPDGCYLSIDTTLSPVAGAAIAAGAHLINDISAGRDDPEIFAVAAASGAPIVLMHMQGTPKTMQDNPRYQDAVGEVLSFLEERIATARAHGVAAEQIVLDPGIGFGKRKSDNLCLMAHLDRFVATGYPVLLGASRKRFMGAILEVTEPTELVAATVATTALGALAGVKIFRVHDVMENHQALEVTWAIRQAR